MRLKSKLKKLNPTIAFKHASSSGLLSVLETGRTPLVLRRALPLEFMDLRAGCSNGRLDELLLTIGESKTVRSLVESWLASSEDVALTSMSCFNLRILIKYTALAFYAKVTQKNLGVKKCGVKKWRFLLQWTHICFTPTWRKKRVS